MLFLGWKTKEISKIVYIQIWQKFSNKLRLYSCHINGIIAIFFIKLKTIAMTSPHPLTNYSISELFTYFLTFSITYNTPYYFHGHFLQSGHLNVSSIRGRFFSALSLKRLYLWLDFWLDWHVTFQVFLLSFSVKVGWWDVLGMWIASPCHHLVKGILHRFFMWFHVVSFSKLLQKRAVENMSAFELHYSVGLSLILYAKVMFIILTKSELYEMWILNQGNVFF